MVTLVLIILLIVRLSPQHYHLKFTIIIRDLETYEATVANAPQTLKWCSDAPASFSLIVHNFRVFKKNHSVINQPHSCSPNFKIVPRGLVILIYNTIPGYHNIQYIISAQ